jgi:hypothetical protein
LAALGKYYACFVKERTNLIGIQKKSLGAKINLYISVSISSYHFVCTGGFIGILMVNCFGINEITRF